MDILFLTFLPLFILIAILYWFMPYATPKSIQFGVRVPRDKESDPAIGAVRKRYHAFFAIGTFIIFCLAFLIPYEERIYFIAVASVPAEIIFSFLNYFRAFSKLRRIKSTERWYDNSSEISGAVYPVEPQENSFFTGFLALLPAIMIILFTVYVGASVYSSLPASIPTHFGANGEPNKFSPKSFGVVYAEVFIQVGMTVGMALLGMVIARTRQETDVSRPVSSYVQQERFKEYTRDSLFLIAAMVDLTLMFSSFLAWGLIPRSYGLELVLLPTLVGAFVMSAVLMSFGQMGSRLSVPAEVRDENTGMVNRNDDRYWKAGTIYYNRNDPSILVAKRFGVGWTLNFGHPISWLVLSCLLALPIVLIIVIMLLH